MSFTIDKYLKIIILCLTIFAFFLSFEVGMLYSFLFIQASIYPIFIRTKGIVYKHIFSILIFTIVIVYYLRPLLLLQDLSFYYYSFQTGNISRAFLIEGLYKISINSFLLISSYTLSVFLLVRNDVVKPKSHNGLLELWRKDFSLLRGKIGYITNLLLFIAGIRLFLILGLGVGMKGVAITSSYAFLARLAPEEFVVGIIVTIFIMFRNQIDRIRRAKLFIALGMVSLAFVATGSKAIVVLIIFFFLVYYISFNIRISAKKFLIYSCLIIIIIPLSFYLGNAVKTAAYLDNLSVSSVFDYTLDYAKKSDIASAFDVVTNRFIGVDGYLAKSRVNGALLYDTFSIGEVFFSAVYMLVPFSESNYETSGVAVGHVVEGFNDNVVHAGALGGYSGLELMFRDQLYIGVILFGVVIVIGTILLNKIKSPFIKFIMFFFYSYFLLLSIMSGNFDVCIAMLGLKLALFVVYFYPVYNFKLFKTK
jgi:hypothetical protein